MKPLDVHALFPHKRTGRNTFGEVRGPEQTDCNGVDMSFHFPATGMPRVQDDSINFGLAAGAALVALAARIATSPAHHKRLLTTLYEAGTIGGTALEALLILHGLEAA